MIFWDTSALVPLLILEPTSSRTRELASGLVILDRDLARAAELEGFRLEVPLEAT